MLRSTLTLALVAAALLPAGGCKKSHAPAPGYPETQAVALPPMPDTPETQQKFDQALEKSGVTDAARAVLIAELEKQAPKYGYQLSDDKEFFKPKGATEQGTPIQVVLVEVSNLKDAEPEPAGQVKMYLERLKEQTAVAQKALDDKRKDLARIDQGEITGGLAPAADPTGEWQSIGETREGEKHFLVEHDGNYYKLLSVNREAKTVHIQEVKEGKVERDVSLPYKYDAQQGQLTTTGAGGGPGDAFVVMEIPNLPDRIFLRPMYETVFAYTVYRRVGRNPNEMPTPRVIPAPGGKPPAAPGK